MTQCIACGQTISRTLFNPEPQPLAALNLPRSQEDALSAIRNPMHFNSCTFCGHVWNTEFEYARVPYAGDSNLMYNSGTLWHDHMQEVIDRLVENKAGWIDRTIIDIGCGDGLFLSLLLKRVPEAKCVGFEPGIEGDRIKDFRCIRDYFIPERDLKKFSPAILTCRHVIEHLDAPREFLADIAYWSMRYDLQPIFLAEVPCFDNAMEVGRISDFLYEHVSNFTLNSFAALFMSSGFQLLEATRLYGDEVAVGFFQPHVEAIRYHYESSLLFDKMVQDTFIKVKRTLENLKRDTHNIVALWGGTGKSAAFLNMFHLNNEEFPLVVDSDPHKLGRYVPGTGQKIEDPEILNNLIEGTMLNLTIIITTPWRAKDIYAEIKRRGIVYQHILVLKNGDLNEYTEL